jgi:hypothetical protein
LEKCSDARSLALNGEQPAVVMMLESKSEGM